MSKLQKTKIGAKLKFLSFLATNARKISVWDPLLIIFTYLFRSPASSRIHPLSLAIFCYFFLSASISRFYRMMSGTTDDRSQKPLEANHTSVPYSPTTAAFSHRTSHVRASAIARAVGPVTAGSIPDLWGGVSRRRRSEPRQSAPIGLSRRHRQATGVLTGALTGQ